MLLKQLYLQEIAVQHVKKQASRTGMGKTFSYTQGHVNPTPGVSSPDFLPTLDPFISNFAKWLVNWPGGWMLPSYSFSPAGGRERGYGNKIWGELRMGPVGREKNGGGWG